MKALRFERFGEPADVLKLEETPDPQPGDSEALVQVRAASINPSDLANIAGRFEKTRLPAIPGRDFAGVVIKGPSAWLGAEVWGTGDGGIGRPGSSAQLMALPVAALRRKPAALSFEAAASVGVTFLVAQIGLIDYARLKAGETVVIVGASGGVGSACVQVASAHGARIVAVDLAAPPPGSSAERLAERAITDSDADPAAIVRELTDGRGADVLLNAVGRETFETSLSTLGHGGRAVVLASPGAPRVSFDLVDFYHRELRLFGLDTLSRDYVAAAAALDGLSAGFESGAFEAPKIDRVVPLEDGVAAYTAMARGEAKGRVVLAPNG